MTDLEALQETVDAYAAALHEKSRLIAQQAARIAELEAERKGLDEEQLWKLAMDCGVVHDEETKWCTGINEITEFACAVLGTHRRKQ